MNKYSHSEEYTQFFNDEGILQLYKRYKFSTLAFDTLCCLALGSLFKSKA